MTLDSTKGVVSEKVVDSSLRPSTKEEIPDDILLSARIPTARRQTLAPIPIGFLLLHSIDALTNPYPCKISA